MVKSLRRCWAIRWTRRSQSSPTTQLPLVAVALRAAGPSRGAPRRARAGERGRRPSARSVPPLGPQVAAGAMRGWGAATATPTRSYTDPSHTDPLTHRARPRRQLPGPLSGCSRRSRRRHVCGLLLRHEHPGLHGGCRGRRRRRSSRGFFFRNRHAEVTRRPHSSRFGHAGSPRGLRLPPGPGPSLNQGPVGEAVRVWARERASESLPRARVSAPRPLPKGPGAPAVPAAEPLVRGENGCTVSALALPWFVFFPACAFGRDVAICLAASN